MSTTRRRFSQKFKIELCREVINSSRPVKAVDTKYGVGAETLRSWLKKCKEACGSPTTEPKLNLSNPI